VGGGSIGLSGEGWKRFGCATLASRVSYGKYLSACQHDAAHDESRQSGSQDLMRVYVLVVG
jgi:hypothetical protein